MVILTVFVNDGNTNLITYDSLENCKSRKKNLIIL